MSYRRRCARPGCDTILSAYNPQPECFLHSDPTWYSQGGHSRLGRWEQKRRTEELDGKHPEDLRWHDRDRKEWAS